MSKKIGIIAVLMLSQFPFVAISKETNTDAAVQRLVKIAKQRKAQGVTSEPTVTKDSTSAANVKVKKPRRVRVNRKNMSESEKMDYEITRISKRVDEINNNIEKFHKTNELLDKMEERLDSIEGKITD
ncbi:FAD-I family protein [Leptotrichia sp. oral taxon 847]|uniref:FAD-I family protein n=1 Tax=Leptotrichia sp. oral taxon 847 TaxID=1785996 RepID=UPI000767E9A6|nr:FAD-I family protein [Leptotrichia sp. oral taxon 847]AMD94308.1 hypothetical protein AXF11_00990 [Leptotrichia sp. oral taxon 847]